MKTGIEPEVVQVAKNSINAQQTKCKGKNHTENILDKINMKNLRHTS